MKPYALISDLHCHAWSSFSTVDPSGINSRLKIIIQELYRTAATLKDAGGHLIVIAGDVFHVRGSIDPEVFNPVFNAFRTLIDEGFEFEAIPGNHDLKSKDTTALGNAFQSLASLPEFRVHTEPTCPAYISAKIAFVPWHSNDGALLRAADELADKMSSSKMDPAEYDLIIHAGINGVIPMLDHGLNAADVAALGFKRVFAGHYHDHKVLEGGKVISIGATTQQTWSDIHTKAGFLIVHEDRIEYHASHAPSFVEIDASTDEDDLPLIVDGNYVRVRGMTLTDAEVNKLRAELLAMNAKGVLIQVARAVTSARGAAPTTTGRSLDQSVTAYIEGLKLSQEAEVKKQALDIIDSVRSVA